MSKYRLFFEKTGRVKYISHLDLMRCFQRAFRRAGTPLKYSEGFNPHPVMSLPLPLSLGTESVCEMLDFETTEELAPDAAQALNPALPEGIRVTAARPLERKSALIAWLRAELTLTYDSGVTEGAERVISELFSRDSLVIRKKTKSGEGSFDLIPAVNALSVRYLDGRHLVIDAVVSAQNPSLNPLLLAEAVKLYLPELAPDFVSCMRREILDADLKPFE